MDEELPEPGERLERTQSHLWEERDELEAQLTELRAEHARTQEELATAREKVQHQCEEVEALREQLGEMTEDNKELEFRNTELIRHVQSLDRALRDATDDLEDDGQDSDEANSACKEDGPINHNVDSSTEDTALRERLVQLQSENRALKRLVSDLREKSTQEEEARIKAQQEAREKENLVAAARRREQAADEERARLATEYEELPRQMQQMQALYRQAELERARMMEEMAQREAEERSMMGLVADDGPSLLDELDEPPEQPDNAATEQLKQSFEQKQEAQRELEENRRELRELRAHMEELQHKWDAQLLQAQREEAKREQEREQRQQQEAIQAELRAQTPRRLIVVYENERRPLMEDPHPDASPEGFHSSTLFDMERPNFSNSAGDERFDPKTKPDAMLPDGVGWEWDGDWSVDLTGADGDGWQYAFNFVRTPTQRLRGEDIQWYSTCNEEEATYVRRRRWVRRAINTAKFRHDGLGSPMTDDLQSHMSAKAASLKLAAHDLMRTTTTTHDALFGLLEGRSGAMLPKNVSVQFLQTAAGGTALEGHLYKEGRGWPRTWEERYFVLWPKLPVPGTELGLEHKFQLLFYFENIDSTTTSGVGMVSLPETTVCEQPTQSIETGSPSMIQTRVQMEHYSAQEAEKRKGFECRKLVYDEIVGVSDARLETQPRVLKIGMPLATAAKGESNSTAESTGERSEIRQWERALIRGGTCLAAGTLSRQVEWSYAGASSFNLLRYSKGTLADVVTELQQPGTDMRPIKIKIEGHTGKRTFDDPPQAVKWLLSLNLDALALDQCEHTPTDGKKGFSEPTCWTCQVEFSMMKRRHHCRACKHAFCDSCSSFKALVRGYDAPQRVCEACYRMGSNRGLEFAATPLESEPEPEPEPECEPTTVAATATAAEEGVPPDARNAGFEHAPVPNCPRCEEMESRCGICLARADPKA